MPELTRRDALAALLSFAAAGAGGRAEGCALPVSHYAPLPGQKRRKDCLVLSHWHYFPLSFDNKPAGEDRYDLEMLTPDGENGRHSKYGGFLRDRPLPRDPIEESDWRVIDAISDIAFGQEAGLDGFQFNIASFDPKERYLDNLQALLTAVERTQTSFRIAIGVDCHTLRATPPLDIIAPQLVRFLRQPGALRMPDGRTMLSCFRGENWSAQIWEQLFAYLKEAGITVYFAPVFLDPGKTSLQHMAMADMVGWWQGNSLRGVDKLYGLMMAARVAGKASMFSVWPQDCRPRNGWFGEARNSELFRKAWNAALQFDPDCVNILTWNDYSENSHIRPSLGTQYAFADLNRYFADAYRFGQTPKITHDTLYYFARRDFTAASRGLFPDHPAMTVRFETPASDEIELLAFLASAGELTIETSAGSITRTVPAGISSLRAPLAAGQPVFSLTRDSALVASASSHFEIRDRWDWQDLVYRGGSSNRPVARQSPSCRTLRS